MEILYEIKIQRIQQIAHGSNVNHTLSDIEFILKFHSSNVNHTLPDIEFIPKFLSNRYRNNRLNSITLSILESHPIFSSCFHNHSKRLESP